MSQEAIKGWETAEEEVISLKKRLDEALQQRVVEEERLTHLDAALKECMQQLRFVREEQEHRIHDAVMKTAREFEKSQETLEDKFSEASKRISKLGIENTQLTRVLRAKERLMEDLNKQRTQVEADFDSLSARLELTEKENASLKYEVRVLEKELEIRNEEREFNRRTANASQKQHLESAKKIAKLESECQRLRILVRKRLPGPAALARMKNEVEIMGRDSVEMMRRNMSSRSSSAMPNSSFESTPDTPSTKINFLMKHLHSIEEENKTLKEALNRNTNELQCSRVMYARTASKLSQVELQLEELSKGSTPIESTSNKYNLASHELSLPLMSVIGSDDTISFSESWASTLISELEHFKNGKQKGPPSVYTVGGSDINLMDDFVEMEKLAIISVDKSSGSPHVSCDDSNAIISSFETESSACSSEAKGRQIVPVSECHSGNRESKSNHIIGKIPGWLQDIVKVILDQNSVSRRKPDEILKDIRAALEYTNDPDSGDLVDARENIECPDACKPTGNSSVADNSSGGANVAFSAAAKTNQLSRSDFEKSIGKIIELIEGVTPPHPEYGTPDTLSHKDGSLSLHKNLKSSSGYVVRVFQWKSSEIFAVLQKFIRACHDLWNGKSDINQFAEDLSSSLEWIMNHCFSLQDVSSMRHEIKEHFDWDESGSESEEVSQFSEADKLHLPIEQLYCLPMVAASDGHNNFWGKEEHRCTVKDENIAAIDGLANIEIEKKDLEPQSATEEDELRMNKLPEAEKTTEYQKLINGDLDKQLIVTQDESNVACENFSSLEIEVQNPNDCNELNKEKQLRTDWEITAASEKLAECQEAILNLGKQLKALASPMEAAIFDKIVTTPTDTDTTAITATSVTATKSSALILPSMKKITNQRSTLLDRMLAEDNAKAMTLTSPKASKSDGKSTLVSIGSTEPLDKVLGLNGIEDEDNDGKMNSLAIVPSKKGSGESLWRKLLWRKRKGDGRKTRLPSLKC
ncbi:filament-like plant protein 7 isoform X1 [Tripterygium wilfordii]|uniref:Filament-like plant protein 7 isoform X1 n=2 Tax=Tripterygium wilfordii TaxID=458696 RepID=A0A7J7E2Q9_TRIWF|nr:filament-like plant protein 7 isoform X1 [Tripterygium wilfordii]